MQRDDYESLRANDSQNKKSYLWTITKEKSRLLILPSLRLSELILLDV